MSEASRVEAKLKVKILGAEGLRNADYVGKSDPYCVCRLPRKPDFSFQTKVVSNDLNPKWNAEFILEDFVGRDTLDLDVFDHDAFKQDDFLGRATLRIEDILPNGFQGALPLSGAGAKGVVNVIIEVTNALPQQSTLTENRTNSHAFIAIGHVSILVSVWPYDFVASFQLPHPRHADLGSLALSFSIAPCSWLFGPPAMTSGTAACEASWPATEACRTFSTSTVNLIASTAALVRK